MISQEKIKSARDAGYSNSEIADYLANNEGLGDKIAQARDAGYSDDEILGYLESVAQPTKEVSQPVGKFESAAAGFGQGATANFSDEIIAGLTAPVIYGAAKTARMLGANTRGLSEKSLAEIYRTEQVKNQAQIRAAQEANPASYLGGEVGGAIATAVKTAGTKAGQVAAKYLGTGSLPVRIAKAAPVSTAAGALAGAGAADSENIAEGAKGGAQTSLLLSPAGPIVGDVGGAIIGGVKTGTTKAATKALQIAKQYTNPESKVSNILEKIGSKIPKNSAAKIPNSDDIQELARTTYKQADELGGSLNDTFTNRFLDNIESAKPKPIAGKVLTSEDQDLIKTIDEFEDLRGSKLSLEDAERIDKALTNKITSALDNGRATPKSKAINDIQIKFRNSLEKPEKGDIIGDKAGFDAYQKATKLWSQSAKLRDIETIIERAQEMPNPDTALRTGFRNLYYNAKKSRGYTNEEKKLIYRAFKNPNIAVDLLSSFGNRGIPLIAAATGQGVAGTAGAALSSIAARGIREKLQTQKAEDVVKAIINRGKPQTEKIAKYPLLSAALGSASSELNNKKSKK